MFVVLHGSANSVFCCGGNYRARLVASGEEAGHIDPSESKGTLLMDLGFAGLIEEIDKRFGPFVTNFLLILLFIGIALWVFTMILSAFQEIEKMINSGDFRDVLLAIAYRIAIVTVFVVALLGIGEYRFRKKARTLLAEIDQSYEKYEKARERFLETVERKEDSK